MSSAAAPISKVLLVDDLAENLLALKALVSSDDRLVFCANSGTQALSLMLEHEFALALMDVHMPGMDGFELAELMRGTERTRRIPIVFVSAAGQEVNSAFRGYESGAVDFLYKPLDPHTVRSKVSIFVELDRQRRALEQAHSELERAVRMRDDFMSMISHELRSPLNTLFLQTQLRRKAVDAAPITPGNEAMRRMVERDERQIRSMIRLIDDMLDVSRLRTGRLHIQPQACDLAAVARRVVGDFAEQAAARSTPLTLQAPDALAGVWDEMRIEQVIINLLTNALRYGEGRPVSVQVADDSGWAVLTVIDSGRGIALEDQERIFGQFERAADDNNAKGLGLGLFITRQIVLAHGGSITVRSALGRGAQFSVRLPSRG